MGKLGDQASKNVFPQALPHASTDSRKCGLSCFSASIIAITSEMREQDDEAIERAREGRQQVLDHIAARTSREKGAAPVRRHGDVVVGPDTDTGGLRSRPVTGTHHVAGVETYRQVVGLDTRKGLRGTVS